MHSERRRRAERVLLCWAWGGVVWFGLGVAVLQAVVLRYTLLCKDALHHAVL
jgi:hypothetical protein